MGISSRLLTFLRLRPPPEPPVPFNFKLNRYPSRKHWPPKMSTLSPIQQFRYEKKFKRRMKLKWARPVWTKWVRIVQYGSITFCVVYGLLFMDWEGQDKQWTGGKEPFLWIRQPFWNFVGSIWTLPERDSIMRNPNRGDRESSKGATKDEVQ